MLKPWSIPLDMAARPILWLDVERRKADVGTALSTMLHEGKLVISIGSDPIDMTCPQWLVCLVDEVVR